MVTIVTGTGVGGLDELLKRLYAPWEIEQLVNVTYPILADCAAKGSASLGGEGFYFPVRVETAQGHAYIDESQDLPPGGTSVVRQAQVNPKIHAGVVQLSGLSMSVSSGNAMAFAQAFDENVTQTIESMSAYKEGAFFRDGSGIIGTFNGNPAATAGPHTLDDVAYLREGMTVAVFDESTRAGTDEWLHGAGVGATAGRLQILEVDWVNRQVTFTAAIEAGVDDNDTIFIAGSQSEADGDVPTNKEPTGLAASLAASGTYLTIDRAAFPNWKSNVITAAGFLDESLLLQGRTRITQETGIPLASIASRFAVLTHPAQVDVLFKLAIPRIRYSGNDRFDLGNSDEVYFGNTPFKTSYNAPSSEAYLGDWMYSQSLYTPSGELHIDTEYNGAALKWVATKDVGLVFCKEYHEFINKRPQAFVKYQSLSEPSR